ncbi:MAG: hypothetical protein ACLSDJ_06640, partial [Butyricimonas faecihominis]
IYEDYRKNPTELRKIRQTIDVVRNDPDVRITSLSIKGYASPEGTYANNTRLAKGRTATLKTYVRELYHFPDSVILTSYEPEDWFGLEAYVDSTNLKNRDDTGAYPFERRTDAKEKMIKSTYPEDYQFLLKMCIPVCGTLITWCNTWYVLIRVRRDSSNHENSASKLSLGVILLHGSGTG